MPSKTFNRDHAIISKNADEMRMDANETAFFARELEHVKARTYDVKYPMLKAANGELLPISTEAGAGAEVITYQQYDQAGIAKIVSNYADDLPPASVKGKEFMSPVKSLGISYGYSIQEIRAAAMVGRSLESREAMAARRGNEQTVNNIAFFGNAATGLKGLLTHPNVSEYTLPTDGTGTSSKFKDKTPTQVIRDLNAMVQKIISVTNGVHMPNTLAIPPDVRAYLAATPRSDNSDTTILDYWLNNNGFVDTVIDCVELTGAGTGGTDMMLVYERSPETGTLEIPVPFEQMPVQRKNLAFEVPCHSRIGGVILYYPLAFCKASGI